MPTTTMGDPATEAPVTLPGHNNISQLNVPHIISLNRFELWTEVGL